MRQKRILIKFSLRHNKITKAHGLAVLRGSVEGLLVGCLSLFVLFNL